MREETMKELDGVLQQAVKEIQSRPVPEDALAATLNRVRNQRPAVATAATPKPAPSRRGWSRVLAVTVVVMAWIAAAGAFAVQDWNESQRRLMAVNNLRPIGLALHNYHDEQKHLFLPMFSHSIYEVDGHVRGISESTPAAPDTAQNVVDPTFHRPQFLPSGAAVRELMRLEGKLWGGRHSTTPNKLARTDSARGENDVEIHYATPASEVAAADVQKLREAVFGDQTPVAADPPQAPTLVRRVPVVFNRRSSNADGQRVIHTAEISLVTKDVLKLEQELRELLDQFAGYTAEAQVNQPQGDLRSARWVVRVPVDKFTAFLDAAAALGIPEYRRANAQDVTEEYVDVQARIANQKKLEQRLLDLLAERDGDLKDVIAVEQQLNNIRGQIEQSEGRQKYLEHQTDLASAVIISREESQYVPPQARTIGSEVRLAWSNSLDALGRFGKGLVVTAVAGGPWLVLAAIPLVLVVRWFRRWRRRRAAKSSV